MRASFTVAIGALVAACSASHTPPTATRADALAVWAKTPPMAKARHFHSAARLEDGRVLVAGGLDGVTPLSSAELYDPKTHSWSSAGSMAETRSAFGMAVVASGVKAGLVVVAGGGGKSTAEAFDRATGAWKSIKPMKIGRSVFPMIGISSYVVAISGAGIERWNSYTDEWEAMPPLPGAPVTLTAAAIGDNRILVVLGMKDFASQDCYGTTRIINVLSGTLWSAAPLSPPRCARLVTLPGNRVLAYGGTQKGAPVTDTEVWDAATETWTKRASVPSEHAGQAVLLGSGRVLYAGGYAGGGEVDTAHTYDPTADKWTLAPSLPAPVQLLSLTPLATGGALAAGGVGAGGSVSLAEIFDETGKACASDDQCPGHVCVDGVCCDSRCDGVCEACDVVGSVGSCVALTGRPHGARAACDATAPSDVCKAHACDGKDRKTCATLSREDCKAPACGGGAFTPAAKCDGAGACVESKPTACGDYACDPMKGCFGECATTAECALGLVCKTRKCVKGCSDDRQRAIAADGTESSCGAYLCDPADGKCRTACTATVECAPGAVCDTVTKTCTPAGGATADDGGCTFAPRGSFAWALLLLAFVRRRR